MVISMECDANTLEMTKPQHRSSIDLGHINQVYENCICLTQLPTRINMTRISGFLSLGSLLYKYTYWVYGLRLISTHSREKIHYIVLFWYSNERALI